MGEDRDPRRCMGGEADLGAPSSLTAASVGKGVGEGIGPAMSLLGLPGCQKNRGRGVEAAGGSRRAFRPALNTLMNY